MKPNSLLLALCALLPVLAKPGSLEAQTHHLKFQATYDAKMAQGPFTGRVYLLFGEPGSQPRNGMNWFNPSPMFSVEVKDWKAGDPLVFDDQADGFPSKLSEVPPKAYFVQLVVRLNRDTHEVGKGVGNLYSEPAAIEVKPEARGTVELVADQMVEEQPFPETDRLKLVELKSELLSKFHGREIRHRAAVILPEGDPDQPRPVLYVIPGFGGDHRMAGMFASPRFGYAKEFIKVVLDPDCETGHHVFADSAYNGPRGQALIEELIPHIDRTFKTIAEPRARFVNGHSSGGWSSLWLQVAYPDTFGGVWSTSPDPVDFRDFSGINLYEPEQNAFTDRQGKRRGIARMGDRVIIYLDSFSKMEEPYGPGQQLGSFEAVFSPLGPDRQPQQLWDRKTGLLDPQVAKAWEDYDIRLKLERNWADLAPKLKGKLHVYTGEKDTFYLEGAVRLLKESLETLGSDAKIEIVPGRDHSNLLDVPMAERIGREMSEAVAPALSAGKPANQDKIEHKKKATR